MKDLKRYFLLKAQPKDVFNALTDKNMLEIWTGEDAVMEPVTGTEFSLWGGSISGVNLDEEAANMIRFQQAYSAAAQEKGRYNLSRGSFIRKLHAERP